MGTELDAVNKQGVLLVKQQLRQADLPLVNYGRRAKDHVPGFDVIHANNGVMVIYAATGERPKRSERPALIARLEECLPHVKRALGSSWTVRLVTKTEWSPHIFAVKN